MTLEYQQIKIGLLNQLPLTQEESVGELKELINTFNTLHNMVNDPTTRDQMAERKCDLLIELAEVQLAKRQNSRCNIVKHSVQHETTGIKTHNVVITIGDPQTGPSTIHMIHHDVIKASDKDENGNIKINATLNGDMVGETIQDNTIHLAVAINSLDKIEEPTQGAVQIVLTDHEENGCLGSNALTNNRILKVSPNYPVAFIAAESTQSEWGQNLVIAAGHKGKLDTQVEGLPTTNLANSFTSFYESLFTTEKTAYIAESKELDHTAGTSTYGVIDSEKGLQARIDFRTNELVTPENVAQMLAKNLENGVEFDLASLTEQVRNQINNGLIELIIEGGRISINSKTKLMHPSTFNPENNETALPALYLAVQALNLMGMTDLNKITWGDKSKMNSNPAQASVECVFSIDESGFWKAFDALLTNQIKPNKVVPDTKLQIKPGSTVLTGAVMSPDDVVTQAIYSKMSAGSVLKYIRKTMNFMTDIGAPFNYFKNVLKHAAGIYGFIFGVGNPKLLHQKEELTMEEIAWLQKESPRFINTIHQTLVARSNFQI